MMALMVMHSTSHLQGGRGGGAGDQGIYMEGLPGGPGVYPGAYPGAGWGQ